MNRFLITGLLIATIAVVPGCAQFDAVKAISRDRGAKAYDGALDSAVYFQCEAASAGSIRRKFATNEADWNAWKTLCNIAGDFDPTRPDGPRQPWE